MRPVFEALGFDIEYGSHVVERGVLFGDQGKKIRSFKFDGYREEDGIALEVESGGAIYNNRVLKDLIEMCLSVDVSAGIIAVPLAYETDAKKWDAPYPKALDLFQAIFANPERFKPPLEGLLLLGY